MEKEREKSKILMEGFSFNPKKTKNCPSCHRPFEDPAPSRKEGDKLCDICGKPLSS